MSNERKDTTDGLDPADDAALWRLLGRAREPEVSPYFARRTLREVTLFEETRRGGGRVRGWGWLAGLRGALRGPRAAVWPGAVVVAVFWLSVVLTTNTPAPRRAPVPAKGTAALATTPADLQVADVDGVAPQDVEVIADLDNMISREESRVWTDDTARF